MTKVIGIVFYIDKAKGRDMFSKVIEKYKMRKIRTTYEIAGMRRMYCDSVTFENGDHWRLVDCLGAQKGYNWNMAYVPEELEKEYPFFFYYMVSSRQIPTPGSSYEKY